MGLQISDLATHPMKQFATWYTQAEANESVYQPNAMAIATIGTDEFPSNRYVLMKHHDLEGVIFYTNLTSKKGMDLQNNPRIAAVMYWKPLSRQIRIQGIARRVPDEIADNYFTTRSRESQLGAWASKQSQELESRETLVERVDYYNQKYPDEVPRPSFWSGYRIIPQKVEFWQSGDHRLHDRFLYQLQTDKTWKITRLHP